MHEDVTARIPRGGAYLPPQGKCHRGPGSGRRTGTVDFSPSSDQPWFRVEGFNEQVHSNNKVERNNELCPEPNEEMPAAGHRTSGLRFRQFRLDLLKIRAGCETWAAFLPQTYF